MDDMSESYQEIRSRKRTQRAANLAIADPTGWTQHTPYHWSRILNGKLLNYWPSTRKWHYDNQTYTGDIKTFIAEYP